MPVKKFIPNKRLKICFESEYVQQCADELLEHRCTQCKDRPPDKTFRGLKDHMRRVHHLFYCDLCAELKVRSSSIWEQYINSNLYRLKEIRSD